MVGPRPGFVEQREIAEAFTPGAIHIYSTILHASTGFPLTPCGFQVQQSLLLSCEPLRDG